MTIPVRAIDWKPCWRIIPSRFPPVGLFDRVTDPADLEAVIALETLTNPRVRDEVGEVSLVAPEDRVSGPGTSIIMAAFTQPNPDGSRLSDGTYGVFYAANDLETAIAETAYHRQKFLTDTRQPPIELDMRVYAVDLSGPLHDLRGLQATYPQAYDNDNHAGGQALGRSLRDAGSLGVAYDSIRRAGGDCVGAFKPRILSNCRQERHLCYRWDGGKIADVYEKRALGG